MCLNAWQHPRAGRTRRQSDVVLGRRLNGRSREATSGGTRRTRSVSWRIRTACPNRPSSASTELEALAAAGGENLRESLNAAGWVGDAVVEDDYGSGGEIFCYEPADVPDGRMHGVVRVGGAEHALVAVGLG